jgi:hypothetical protein
MAVKPKKPARNGEISQPPSILIRIVLPIILLVTLLIVLMSNDTSRLLAPCEHYLTIKLAYPLIFGALGAILGGNITLSGPTILFGGKWDGQVAGGIAAALLGFGIALWAEPKSCSPKQELVLQNFITRKQVEVTDGGKKVFRDYIARFDSSDREIQIVVDKSRDNSRDLKFMFTGQDRFRISLDFFRKADPSSQYEPMPGCLIDVLVEPTPDIKDTRLYQLMSSNARYEVQFNPLFFEQFEEALKKGNIGSSDTSCLTGRSRLNGKTSIEHERITGPLYATRSSEWPAKLFRPPELWFVTKQTSEATKESARVVEVAEVDAPVLSPRASVPKQVDNPVPAKPPAIPGCNPGETERFEIDKYLGGDDLDKQRRGQLYVNWKDLHCYVWLRVSRKDGSSPSSERARAIRLVANAIINESQIIGAPFYWQPSGANKRDFSRDIPYLAAGDHRIIVDLVQEDDVLVRGEALRMIRTLPIDRFDTLFRAANDGVASLTAVQRERMAIAASFMYYNRMVEWLDDDSIPASKIVPALDADFKAGRKWAIDSNLGKGAKSYDAMLLYARGIVERERELIPDKGVATFTQMTNTIRQMEDSYPSNFRHLGQSLAISQGGTASLDILRQITQVETYPPATPLVVDQTVNDSLPLYVGPGEQFNKLPRTLSTSPATRLLLRKGDWYLATGPGWIGWFRRSVKP